MRGVLTKFRYLEGTLQNQIEDGTISVLSKANFLSLVLKQTTCRSSFSSVRGDEASAFTTVMQSSSVVRHFSEDHDFTSNIQ